LEGLKAEHIRPLLSSTIQFIGDQAEEARHDGVIEHMGTLAHFQERCVLLAGVGELFIDIPCNLRERTERLPLGCIGVGHGARLSVYERLSVREIPFRVFRSISKCRGESQAFIERRSRRPPLSS
jgi:hypothetical protein